MKGNGETVRGRRWMRNPGFTKEALGGPGGERGTSQVAKE